MKYASNKDRQISPSRPKVASKLTELKQPSDNVNRNQDTLYDVEASFTGFGHLRVSGAIHALADGLLRTLPKDHIDSEYAGSYAETEVDCQNHGKAGDHASAFHQTTDESQNSKKGEKGEHHRLNPERNFFTLIQRMLTWNFVCQLKCWRNSRSAGLPSWDTRIQPTAATKEPPTIAIKDIIFCRIH